MAAIRFESSGWNKHHMMRHPRLGWLRYEMYISIVQTMGLKRDPDQGFWIGGWPIFLLPNGDTFPLSQPFTLDFNSVQA